MMNQASGGVSTSGDQGSQDAFCAPVENRGSNAELSFMCTFAGCNKLFTSRWNLTRHVLIHTGEKPYKCNMPGCNKQFIQKCSLARHQRTHLQYKQWVCDYPGCLRTFKLKEYLDVHKRTHGKRRRMDDDEGEGADGYSYSYDGEGGMDVGDYESDSDDEEEDGEGEGEDGSGSGSEHGEEQSQQHVAGAAAGTGPHLARLSAASLEAAGANAAAGATSSSSPFAVRATRPHVTMVSELSSISASRSSSVDGTTFPPAVGDAASARPSITSNSSVSSADAAGVSGPFGGDVGGGGGHRGKKPGSKSRHIAAAASGVLAGTNGNHGHHAFHGGGGERGLGVQGSSPMLEGGGGRESFKQEDARILIDQLRQRLVRMSIRHQEQLAIHLRREEALLESLTCCQGALDECVSQLNIQGVECLPSTLGAINRCKALTAALGPPASCAAPFPRPPPAVPASAPAPAPSAVPAPSAASAPSSASSTDATAATATVPTSVSAITSVDTAESARGPQGVASAQSQTHLRAEAQGHGCPREASGAAPVVTTSATMKSPTASPVGPASPAELIAVQVLISSTGGGEG